MNVCLFIFQVFMIYLALGDNCAFSAVTLLVGHHEEHPVCRNWVMRCCGVTGVVICLERGADCAADATAIPKAHLLLPHLNPDWF